MIKNFTIKDIKNVIQMHNILMRRCYKDPNYNCKSARNLFKNTNLQNIYNEYIEKIKNVVASKEQVFKITEQYARKMFFAKGS